MNSNSTRQPSAAISAKCIRIRFLFMTSTSDISDSDYDDRLNKPRQVKSRKRRKRTRDDTQGVSVESEAESVTFSLGPLIPVLRDRFGAHEDSFEDVINPLLPEYEQIRNALQTNEIELDEYGNKVRPLTHFEAKSFLDELARKHSPSLIETIVSRKLKLQREKSKANIRQPTIKAPDEILTPLPSPPQTLPVNKEVLDALYNIKTTPFDHSFLSRLHGFGGFVPPGLVAVDWETQTPWMNVMADIREHYLFAHPEREPPMEDVAPITYSTLHAYQLPQIHDLLERSFWTGINISDSLDYCPEKATMVAMYKKIVVGVAILSSPRETYITYLAVKAGWDKAQIGRTMLYHLIVMNPHKDITLHVSVNSSAMLLYNQFGFKAEQFVAGFYSSYLDPQSRASKNAFMLRLRHQ